MSEITIAQIKPDDARSMLASNRDAGQLIDVRSVLEFESEHIDGSINIPLDQLPTRSAELKKKTPIILVCRSGGRAGRGARLLAPHGFDVIVLAGGIQAWQKEGLPLKNGKKRPSIERQTQLAIGGILLTSTACGFFLSKWFFIVPAVMGAGLTFAGLSGTCGLAVLIALAPWNKSDSSAKVSEKPSCCS